MCCIFVFGKTCSLLPLSKYRMRLRLADICVQVGTTQQNLIVLITILLHSITQHLCRPVVVSENFGLEADLSRNKAAWMTTSLQMIKVVLLETPRFVDMGQQRISI